MIPLKVEKIPGTVIVITDGVPNDGARWVPQERKYDYTDCRRVIELRRREIKQVLEETRSLNREIELRVIGLGLGAPPNGVLNAEQQQALKNEQVATKELEEILDEANGRKGKFIIAKANALRGVLNISTGARHVFAVDRDQPSSTPKDGPLNEALNLPAGTKHMAPSSCSGS